MADKPLRLGWWWLPIILLGLLAIACLVLTLWLNSSADLDAQIARAKALGLSMDPTPAAVRRSSSDALLLKRIASICESSPRYVGNDSGQWRWDPFR